MVPSLLEVQINKTYLYENLQYDYVTAFKIMQKENFLCFFIFFLTLL